MESSSEHLSISVDVSEGISTNYQRIVEYTLGSLFRNHCLVDQPISLHLTLKENEEAILVSSTATDRYSKSRFDWDDLFADGLIIKNDNGSNDYISTIVYLVNYLQEYGAKPHDSLGRFGFSQSLQYNFNCVEENLVLSHFRRLVTEFNINGVRWKQQSSRIFVSHDIDTIHGGLLQDGFYALKKGRFDILLQLLWNEAMARPAWFNLDRIMDITSEYDVKSTFFWLVNQHRVEIEGRSLRNSDYDLKNRKVAEQIDRIKNRGFEIGLHKSLSETNFSEEMGHLALDHRSNRNHFLKLSVPAHFDALDAFEVEIDFSMGFAEHFGFRNSYGLPYRPFHPVKGRAFECLMVPLNVMDTTNWTYMKLPKSEMQDLIVSFIEKNKNDAVLSILWHNNYFSELKYNGYLDVYKFVLDYCRQTGLTGITQSEILADY
ncbi:MAG: hypothetical protein KC456_07330 [Flavobacteriales bacterium]|nr:hypothetical protein [Flavobacteriales bacterium]